MPMNHRPRIKRVNRLDLRFIGQIALRSFSDLPGKNKGKEKRRIQMLKRKYTTLIDYAISGVTTS